jgi:hypothetical protein
MYLNKIILFFLIFKNSKIVSKIFLKYFKNISLKVVIKVIKKQVNVAHVMPIAP